MKSHFATKNGKEIDMTQLTIDEIRSICHYNRENYFYKLLKSLMHWEQVF